MGEVTVSPEVSARASLPKEPGAAEDATLTKIRQELSAQKNANASERFGRARTAQEAFNPGTRKVLLDANFGTERNADGTRNLDTEEALRLKSAEKSEKLARELVEIGYDRLNSGQQKDARRIVERAISISPVLKDQLPTNPTQKDQMLAQILKDPDLLAEIVSVYGERMGVSAKLDDLVSEARKNLDEKTQQEAEAQTELAETNNRLTVVGGEIARFDPIADRGKQLADLELVVPDLREEVDTITEELRQTQETIAMYKQMLFFARTVGDQQRIQGQIQGELAKASGLRSQKTEANKKINQYNTLIEDKKRLSQEKTDLEKKKQDLTNRLNVITKDKLMLQAEVSTAQLQRGQQEEDFLNDVNGILTEATYNYLESQLTRADETQKRVLEDMLKTATTDTEKRFLTQQLSRYDRPRTPTLLNSRKTEPNTVNIDGDTTILFSSDPVLGGPEGLLRKQLLDSGATASQVDEMLKDKDFVEKMGSQAVESLLAAKLKSGRLTEDEAEKIIKSPWGKGMVDSALQSNQKVKDAMEALRSQGVIKGDIRDAIGRMDKKSLLAVLLLVIGTGGLAGFGLAVGASKVLN